MKKILCSVLAAALIFGTCGCSKSEKSQKNFHENVSLNPINFDEAVKSIRLSGHEFSLPYTQSDLGSDFSLEKTETSVGNIKTYALMYKGKKVGHAFTDVESQDPNSVPMKAVSIGLISMDWPFQFSDDIKESMLEMLEPIELEAAGLSFSSTFFDVEKVLGEPTKIEETRSLFEVNHNGGHFMVEFYRGKICGMEISLIGGTENEH